MNIKRCGRIHIAALAGEVLIQGMSKVCLIVLIISFQCRHSGMDETLLQVFVLQRVQKDVPEEGKAPAIR